MIAFDQTKHRGRQYNPYTAVKSACRIGGLSLPTIVFQGKKLETRLAQHNFGGSSEALNFHTSWRAKVSVVLLIPNDNQNVVMRIRQGKYQPHNKRKTPILGGGAQTLEYSTRAWKKGVLYRSWIPRMMAKWSSWWSSIVANTRRT